MDDKDSHMDDQDARDIPDPELSNLQSLVPGGAASPSSRPFPPLFDQSQNHDGMDSQDEGSPSQTPFQSQNSTPPALSIMACPVTPSPGIPKPKAKQPVLGGNAPTLMDVLNMSTSMQSSSPTTSSEIPPMDDNKKEFLEKTFKDLMEMHASGTTLERLVNSLQLYDSPTLSFNTAAFEECLKTLAAEVECIDIANDFLRMGGLQILARCLSSPSVGIRSQALTVFARVVQNNEVAVRICNEANVLSHLMPHIVPGSECQEAALLAVSCYLRANPQGCREFCVSHDGINLLLDISMTAGSSDRSLNRCSYILATISSVEMDDKGSISYSKGPWLSRKGLPFVKHVMSIWNQVPEPEEKLAPLLRILCILIVNYEVTRACPCKDTFQKLREKVDNVAHFVQPDDEDKFFDYVEAFFELRNALK